MTCTYKGRTYHHTQIWALVEALNANGFEVQLNFLPHRGCYALLVGRRITQTWLRYGMPGDRSPFRALCRAVEAMNRRTER